MEPLEHIAGVGAAVIGSLTNFVSVPLAITIRPLLQRNHPAPHLWLYHSQHFNGGCHAVGRSAPQDVTVGETAG